MSRLVIDDTLKRRGRHLGAHLDAVGLAELFSDLRVPPEVASALYEWHTVLGELAARVPRDQGQLDELAERGVAEPTYETFLYSMRRAHARLRTHLDALFGAILLANINLAEVLDASLRQPGQMISLSDLEDALQKAGVNLATVDTEDILRVLDPNSR